MFIQRVFSPAFFKLESLYLGHYGVPKRPFFQGYEMLQEEEK